MTANSSPPSRATVSDSRTSICRRWPISRSTASPIRCPIVSLISLKPSRSMMSTESGWRVRKGIGHRHLEAILKQRPVRQVRQAVVVGEVADALFGLRALAPHVGIAQFAVDRGDQAAQVVLDDVVVGAVLHRIDGDLFADRARHENERHFEAAIANHRERGGAAEARHRVVGNDEIPVVTVERLAQRVRRCRHACARARSRPAAGARRAAARRSPSPQPAGVEVVSCSTGYRAIQAVLNCSAFWSRAMIACASFSVLYLPTRTRKSAVGAPFDRIQTNAGYPLAINCLARVSDSRDPDTPQLERQNPDRRDRQARDGFAATAGAGLAGLRASVSRTPVSPALVLPALLLPAAAPEVSPEQGAAAAARPRQAPAPGAPAPRGLRRRGLLRGFQLLACWPVPQETVGIAEVFDGLGRRTDRRGDRRSRAHQRFRTPPARAARARSQSPRPPPFRRPAAHSARRARQTGRSHQHDRRGHEQKDELFAVQLYFAKAFVVHGLFSTPVI